jgi:5-formyltetrahydrofolate cyclo-ligase
MPNLEKTELRKKLIQKRRDIQDKTQKDSVIFKNLSTAMLFLKVDLILTYYSTELEVDTHALLDYCFDKNIAAAIPAIIDETMRFFRVEPRLGELELGEEITHFTNSVCIVPALAYSRNNERLGYGGGYYDRFLRSYAGKKIGLCYKEFVLDIPIEQHDEKVDIVITD